MAIMTRESLKPVEDVKESKSKKAKATPKKFKTIKEKVVVEKKEEKVVEAPKVEKPQPQAKVTLVECATFKVGGITYVRGRPFVVTGLNQIKYYKNNKRFEVVKI
jgi:hypothetical protein